MLNQTYKVVVCSNVRICICINAPLEKLYQIKPAVVKKLKVSLFTVKTRFGYSWLGYAWYA